MWSSSSQADGLETVIAKSDFTLITAFLFVRGIADKCCRRVGRTQENRTKWSDVTPRITPAVIIFLVHAHVMLQRDHRAPPEQSQVMEC